MPNAQMAQEILDLVTEKPKSFDMSTWVSVREEGEIYGEYAPEDYLFTYQKHWTTENICGTTACLAGHATLLAGWKPTKNGSWDSPEGERQSCQPDWPVEGRMALGLSPKDAGIFYDTEVEAIEALKQLAAGAEELDWPKIRAAYRASISSDDD